MSAIMEHSILAPDGINDGSAETEIIMLSPIVKIKLTSADPKTRRGMNSEVLFRTYVIEDRDEQACLLSDLRRRNDDIAIASDIVFDRVTVVVHLSV